MPAGNEYDFMPRHELLSFEEIERVARVFAGLGVRKLRLTGGEPLLRNEIEKLVELLAAIPGVDDLALTTNAFLLPQKAAALAAAGLDRVTVSLPSLRDEVFARLNGVGYKVADVMRGIEAAAAAGLAPIKINIVVLAGVNDDEIVALARWCREQGFVARFIEFMDVGTLNDWDEARVVSAREIVERIRRDAPLEELRRRRVSDVASRFRYVENEAEMGVISSVTEPFCGDCSRARLSAEGYLYTCLFSAIGHDLKTPLREGADNEQLAERIRSIWLARRDRYSEERAAGRRLGAGTGDGSRVEMFRIGG
jgi:cyclic pyranopterin phosphate synthase